MHKLHPARASRRHSRSITPIALSLMLAGLPSIVGAATPASALGGAAGFPAFFQLRSLFSAAGGDGSEGFVVPGFLRNERLSNVSAAGDINGDGINDIMLAQPVAGVNLTGQVFIIYGRDTGFPAEFSLTDLFPGQGGDGSQGFVINGAGTGDSVGDVVAAAGDINADGIDDLVIGGADTAGFDRFGATFVLFGQSAGFGPLVELADLLPDNGGDGSAGFALRGALDQSRAGDRALGSAGDFNGDGIDDLLIGADDTQDLTPIDHFILFGRSTGFPAQYELADLRPEGGGDGSEGIVIRLPGMTGYTPGVGLAGDLNNDGLDDVWVRRRDIAPELEDGISVVFGVEEPAAAVIDVTTLDGSDGFLLQNLTIQPGFLVANAAGDVNGDDIDDFLVGDDGSGISRGAAIVLFGRDGDFPSYVALTDLLTSQGGDGSAGVYLGGVDRGTRTGTSVSGGVDLNNDGLADIIVGADRAIGGANRAPGQVYVFYGRSSAFPAQFDLVDLFPSLGGDGSEGAAFGGVDIDDNAGDVVAGLGDVNGDGIDDFAISAPGGDSQGQSSNTGEIYIVFGKSTP